MDLKTSYEEILEKRIDIICSKQRATENTRAFYIRVKNLRDEHRLLIAQTREKYKELFETKTSTEEFAIIGYILGIKPEVQQYLHPPCEYRDLTAAANHAMIIEYRVRKLKLPIITEGNENLNSL